jgi:hypothetical protein
MPDLVIGRRRRLAERRFAGYRRTVLAPCHKLAGQHRHYRVMAQIVMVEHVLVAQCDAEDALADERCHLMLDQLRRPAVGEAPGKASISPMARSVAPTEGRRHPR